MAFIGIAGEGVMVKWLAQAVQKQPDFHLASEGEENLSAWIWYHKEGEPLPLHLQASSLPIISLGPGIRTWTHLSQEGPPTKLLHIPEAPFVALLRITAALKQITQLHTTMLAPAGLPFEAQHGPIDALLPATPAWVPEGLSPATMQWTYQMVQVPHTRCWLISCLMQMQREFARSEILALLRTAPRVLLVPEGIGFTDTAFLVESFRDRGRPHGSFFETAIFLDYLRVQDRQVQMWIAAHMFAPLPEVMDCLHVLCGSASTDESMKRTNRALGILSAFFPEKKEQTIE